MESFIRPGARDRRAGGFSALVNGDREPLKGNVERRRARAGLLRPQERAVPNVRGFAEVILDPRDIFEQRRGWTPIGEIDMHLAHFAGVRGDRQPERARQIDAAIERAQEIRRAVRARFGVGLERRRRGEMSRYG
ncbi:hypothetical protein [Roseiarcus sp.]|uniref:hypothetical protein n=1 Tax=Roseiarcus sp. TaxID=1969460 RepID=UPI003C765230